MPKANIVVPDSIPAGLPAARRRRIAQVMERCQALAPEGQTVRLAFAVKKGIGSNPLVVLFWFTQLLLVFQQFRVVAVTDDAILVFKSTWFKRETPKRLLQTLPRDTPLTPARRSMLQLGTEKVTVYGLYRPALDAFTAAEAQPAV
jgi:hypothetical protein